MKRVIAAIVVGFALMTTEAFAGNGDLIVDGSLGVGTTSPGTLTEINKTFAIGSPGEDFLRLTASQGGAWFSRVGIQFRWNDTGNGAAWNLGQIMGRVEGWPNFGGGLEFYTKSTDAIITNVPTPKMVINNAGNVGIGATFPAYTLDVNGTIRGNNVSPSDIRLKENIEPVESALAKVADLQGVSFNWKKGERNMNFPAGRHYGVIAQEIEKVLPEVVNTAPDGSKAVAYTEIIPVLIEAIKEQQKLIEEQRAEIVAIKKYMMSDN